ncbi:hypothetical protein F4778DRAFT_492383 [Xylariomycetidae sp. FL2044]|nr:hypothetical protein F4778DRAFT_492383 [Xylariomycetidae sp. FL2044]
MSRHYETAPGGDKSSGTTTTPSSPGGPKPAASRAYETHYHGPPSSFNMSLRRLSSVVLAVFLYSAATPFAPISWVFPMEGGFFIDRLCAGLLLIIACYFQWLISGLDRPLVITLPSPGAQTIRNGRMERGGGSAYVWHTSNYWPYALCETGLLVLAEFGPSEMLRRAVVSAVLAGLWLIGFHATPRSTRMWAWGHIKAFWFWIVLDELLRVGRNNVARRARRY